MGLLRDYMWIWIPIATALGSFVLGITFFLISKYILLKDRSKGFFKPYDTSMLNVPKKHYQLNDKDVPPLPPRTQFLTAGSYESIGEWSASVDVEEVDVGEAVSLPRPMKSSGSCHSDDMSMEDYDDIAEENTGKNVKVDMGEAEFPQPQIHSDDMSMEDYDDIGEENNSNNVKVDKGEGEFLPPPMKSTGVCHSDDISMEDYDDIGEANDSKDGEDYDDVG